MSSDFEAALENLPHGTEFRFIDRLRTLEAGKEGEGEYLIRGTETFLAGHFPGEPMFPGVLLVEAGAQLAGVVAQCDPVISPLKNLKLTAIRAAKILGTAGPGELLNISARISGRMGKLVQASISVRSGNRTLLESDVVLTGE